MPIKPGQRLYLQFHLDKMDSLTQSFPCTLYTVPDHRKFGTDAGRTDTGTGNRVQGLRLYVDYYLLAQ